MNQQQSLYEQLGGEEMVSKTVSIFYRKVLADPRLRPFFEGVGQMLRDWARALTESLRKDILGR